MLVCGDGDQQKGGRASSEKRSSLSRMLIKPALNGMTNLFTCYLHVGTSVIAALPRKVAACAF